MFAVPVTIVDDVTLDPAALVFEVVGWDGDSLVIDGGEAEETLDMI